MAEKRDILWRFLGDAKNLKKASRDAEKSLGGVQKGMGKVSKAAGALGLALGAGVVLDFAGDAVQAAIAADEAASKFQSVFGPAEGFAKRVEELGDKTGVTTSKMHDLFGTLGNLAQNAGIGRQAAFDLTEEVGTLAGDLASFNDANPEEVFKDLAFAITTTERDALKKYGITISETMVAQEALNVATADGRDEVTKADRIYASYKLALEGAGQAVGDLDRTSDSAANRQRRLMASVQELKEEIGRELLPVYEDMLSALGKTLPAAKGAIRGLGEVTNRVEQLGDAWEIATREQEEGRSEWDKARRALGDTLALTLRFASGMTSEFIPAIEDAAESVDRWGETAEEVTRSGLPRMTGGIDRLTGEFRDLEAVIEPGLIFYEDLEVAMEDVADASDRVRDAFGEQMSELDRIQDPLARYAAKLGIAADAAYRLARNVGIVDADYIARSPIGPGATEYPVGKLHGGGVVPGIGERPAILMGGERVIPRGGGGGASLVLNFNGIVGDPDEVARQVADALSHYERITGSPWVGLSG